MKRELQITDDGSHTVAIPEQNITYHSTRGALQESRHVFIDAGLRYILSHASFAAETCIEIFEMGFGTGLNALLSYKEIKDTNKSLYYAAVEPHPLFQEETNGLNYVVLLGDETLASVFSSLHSSAWNEAVAIAPFFILYKSSSLSQRDETKQFHLIYFDAFAPEDQPGLWTAEVFETMYKMLYKKGVLVTYCSKGAVRRTMQAVGFIVEKLKGPQGKREMVRAVK